MMLRRLATGAGSWQAAVIPAGVAIWLLAFGAAETRNSGMAPMVNRVVPALTADAHFTDTVKPVAIGKLEIENVDVAITGDLPTGIAADTSLPPDATLALHGTEAAAAQEPEKHEPEKIVVAALTDSAEILPTETPPVQTAIANAPATESGSTVSVPVKSAVASVENLDECYVMEACVDRFLWALYQRTPKEDAIKEQDQRKVQVKRKGKVVTVTRTFTRVVDEDFGWKDPKAADKAGMSMVDYVIGGVDQGFKLRLFRMLLAAEQAGLSPGITSAFRDDYRQSIASGLKAASDRSYHGGSFRGGYGHGLAADVVSTSGETRAQRQASSEIFWKWIDAHGAEFGVGRPYLDHDPPHVAPIDGKEYADHNGGRRVRQAAANVRKRNAVRNALAAAAKPGVKTAAAR